MDDWDELDRLQDEIILYTKTIAVWEQDKKVTYFIDIEKGSIAFEIWKNTRSDSNLFGVFECCGKKENYYSPSLRDIVAHFFIAKCRSSLPKRFVTRFREALIVRQWFLFPDGEGYKSIHRDCSFVEAMDKFNMRCFPTQTIKQKTVAETTTNPIEYIPAPRPALLPPTPTVSLLPTSPALLPVVIPQKEVIHTQECPDKEVHNRKDEEEEGNEEEEEGDEISETFDGGDSCSIGEIEEGNLLEDGDMIDSLDIFDDEDETTPNAIPETQTTPQEENSHIVCSDNQIPKETADIPEAAIEPTSQDDTIDGDPELISAEEFSKVMEQAPVVKETRHNKRKVPKGKDDVSKKRKAVDDVPSKTTTMRKKKKTTTTEKAGERNKFVTEDTKAWSVLRFKLGQLITRFKKL